MFRVPYHDTRLKNKQEVVALRFDEQSGQELAIDTDFLTKNPVYHGEIGGQPFVILTDKSGANRVFDPGELRFESWDRDQTATDSTGSTWKVDEASLTASDGTKLPRLPAHRAFWFGWHAAYPETQLVSE